MINLDEKLFKNDIYKPDIKAFEANDVLFNKTCVQMKMAVHVIHLILVFFHLSNQTT